MINFLPWRETLFKKHKQLLCIVLFSSFLVLVIFFVISYTILDAKSQETQQLKIALSQQKKLITLLQTQHRNKAYPINHPNATKSVNAIYKNPDGTLSLHFYNVYVRDLLKYLAEYQHKNLILSDAVSGVISLHLQNITWKQALSAILTLKNLHTSEQNSILFIAPATEIHNHELESLSLANLSTHYVPMRYAKAEEVAALLQSKTGDLLSERGRVTFDARTNTLVLKDIPERLAAIHPFLQAIDVPAKQVFIAARIMSVDTHSAQELGLKFGTVKNTSNAEEPQNTFTNEDSGHVTVAVARLSNNAELDLELAALEREGHAQTLSNPELITTNHQSASIESGSEIPYQEKTSSGATNIDFKKAVLRLKVTPEITSENRILLNLVVNQDKISTLTVNAVPAIETQAIETQVLAKNDQTIVLGGIYEQSNSHSEEKVPFLSSVPLLGHALTNKEKHSEQKELLIFVRSRVLS